MKKVFSFIKFFAEKADEMDLISIATEMAFRILLSVFPFLIFIISVIGYLDLDADLVIGELEGIMPEMAAGFITGFMEEIGRSRSAGMLSVSLLVSVFSASSGVRAIIRGFNKAYDEKEHRHIVFVYLVSFFLVILLVLAILTTLLVLIYGDVIYGWVIGLLGVGRIDALSGKSGALSIVFGFGGNLVTLTIMIFAIVAIYIFGCCKKLRILDVLPGAVVTVIVWLLASKGFNVYINNFTRYSAVYGSIGSLMVLMLWLNIISVVILSGALINSMIKDYVAE